MKMTSKQKELLLLFLNEAKIPMSGTVKEIHEASIDLMELKNDVFNAEIIDDEDNEAR